jgi:hypothetical protein
VTVRYTLVSDGSSDRLLLHVLDWLLSVNSVRVFSGQWADLARLRRPPRGLGERLRRAVDLYPCQLLFVHRDAEGVERSIRAAEIRAVLEPEPPGVCVVPVRMQEAWLLFDEAALREASGRPGGREALGLPPLRRLERIADPKTMLHHALVTASGARGRRRRRFPVRERVHRVATLIRDFSPLRNLPAFRVLEHELRALVKERGWSELA